MQTETRYDDLKFIIIISDINTFDRINYNFLMPFKIVKDSQVLLLKDIPDDIKELKSHLSKTFKLKKEYQMNYLDDDKDKICLINDYDIRALKNFIINPSKILEIRIE